jgi:3-oxoacyl-[acyl-carrier protein] reductase
MSVLAGKLALVTGASGIIGSAISRRLALAGADVIVHYGENGKNASVLVDAIEAEGGHAQSICADLSHADGPTELIALLDRSFSGRYAGRLDVLVNNAGAYTFGDIAEASDDDFDRLFAINVRTPFQLARAAARRMRAAGWGRIVNIGSVYGQATPATGMGLYSSTKFAIAGFTRAWSRDLAAAGIMVNAVLPALIQDKPHPTTGPIVDAKERFLSVDRFGHPNDFAEAVAYLTSPAASYINGISLNVDGGWSA